MTICATRPVGRPMPTGVCVPNDGSLPPYIVITCGTSGTDTPVAFCNVAAPPFWDGSDWVTCVKPAGANQRRADPGRDLCRRPGARGAELRQGDLRRVDDDAAAADRCRRRVWRPRTRASSTSRRPRSSLATTAPPVPIRWQCRCRPAAPGARRRHLITTICTFPNAANNHRGRRIRALHRGSADLRRQPGQDDLHGVRRHGLRADGARVRRAFRRSEPVPR